MTDTTTINPALLAFVRETVNDSRYREYLRTILLELINLSTAADSDLAATTRQEQRFFVRLEEMIREAAGRSVAIERQMIPASIDGDPDYSIPGYAVTPELKAPTAGEIYRDRYNLLASVERSGPGPDRSGGLILHAHVDVVPPWFAAREDSGRIYGRGASDNKAQVAILLGQMKILGEIVEKFPQLQLSRRVYQFTIDEEIGGNGSVAAALDARFKDLPILMHESTDLVPYCAHRGCVYYRCELSIGQNPDISAIELYPFVVLSLEAEGRKIQRETASPGFGPEHVQTNHGVLGCYGQHPGNVCDHVAVEITTYTNAHVERMALKLTQYLDAAMVEYFSRYGDKSKEQDASGRPKVAKHFELKVLPSQEGQRVRVDVYGKSGHMAAVRDCDNAITKAALLFGALLKNAAKFANIKATARLADSPTSDDGRTVVLEGGQGFAPSHEMPQIQARMTEAATEAVRKYCKLRGKRFSEGMVRMSFERLHNDAYADSPESRPMAALRGACAMLGHNVPAPKAWTTSCDARIYHHKGHPVAIFGAGKLEAAHSDSEYVDLDDVQKALAISTLATLQLVS